MSEEIRNGEVSKSAEHHHSSSSHHHTSSSHHHHGSGSSHKHSSKKKRSHSSSETKGEKVGRNILAFALFLTISLLSLTVCVRIAFVNPNSVVRIFVNEEYVSALRDDILAFSSDRCMSCNLPADTVEKAISYEDIYALENAYITGALGASKDYTKTTYEDNADEIRKNVKTVIDEKIKSEGLRVDKKQKNGSKKLTDEIYNYILERLEISNIDKLEAVVNVGKIVSLVGIIVFSVFAVIFALIVVSIGTKRYRALRFIVHSVNAAALLNLVLVLGVQLVKVFKDLVLYPTYLADAFMRYINRCELSVCASSVILFTIALVLTTFVWKLNRDSNE